MHKSSVLLVCLLLALFFAPSQQQVCKNLNFDTISAGLDSGQNYAYFAMNGVQNAYWTTGRGIAIAIYNEVGDFQRSEIFDTCGDSNANNALKSYIDSYVGIGYIVMLACKDECSGQLNDTGKAQLARFGFTGALGWRENMIVWAVYGKKYLYAAHNSSSSGRSEVSQDYNTCDIGSQNFPTCGYGQFLDGYECSACDEKCLTCSKSATNCLTCPEAAFARLPITCNCPPKTYEFASDCYACSSDCNKCDQNGCTECAEGFENVDGQGCVDPKAEQERLERCGPNCSNCGENGCEVCTEDHVLENGKCRLSCVIVYSECNFDGESMEVCGSNENFGKKWTIKSIHVPKNQRGITLYTGSEFQGESVTYDSDQECLEKHDLEGKDAQQFMSTSVKIEKVQGKKHSEKKHGHLKKNKK